MSPLVKEWPVRQRDSDCPTALDIGYKICSGRSLNLKLGGTFLL